MTQKTGREQASRKHDHPADTKHPHPSFNLSLDPAARKTKVSLRSLSRGHRHQTMNRRISG